MSTSSSASAPVRTSTRTRSSIRHSLTLASVGKALSDVMNKSDAKEGGEKGVKKSRDSASRRVSAIGLVSGDSDKEAPSKRVDSPDAKTITRKTRSMTASKAPSSSSDEQGGKGVGRSSPHSLAPTRSSSLRVKKAPASSALPKYRPKSAILEPIQEPASPTRKGVRRRLSSSDSDDDKDGSQKDDEVPPSPSSRSSRPISPIPKRSALQVNLTTAINVTPSTPPKKKATPSIRPPSPTKSSPTRPGKSGKPSENIPSKPLPRPPSSASSSGSARTPQAPTTPTSTLRNAFGLGHRAAPRQQQTTSAPSPLRKAMDLTRESPPPKSRTGKQRNGSTGSNMTVTPTQTPTCDTSTDSLDADDVEFLLSAVISPTAPTPAMPRLRVPGLRQGQGGPPETPCRSNLPSRSQLSYLSPAPPSSDNSPLLLRPSKNDRGSILSWEQLAYESSKTLDDGEIETMIADISAPFLGAASPTPSSIQLDVPESPTLSAMPSPGGFGSISQILLPDVTPSPAVHTTQSQLFDSVSSDVPSVDAALVTLLRLQLASAEKLAKERMSRIESLEGQVRGGKESRLREEEEMSRHVTELEEKLQGTLQAKEKVIEEKESYIVSLEDQLRHDQAYRDQAVEQAVIEAHEKAQAAQVAALSVEKQRWEVATVAERTALEWASVRDVAEGELEFLRATRETLTVLLAGLDNDQRQLESCYILV